MQPLADKLRPKTLEELVGQEHLKGEDGLLTRIFSSDRVPSIILWGPAGCGKTTIAKLLCDEEKFFVENISATSTGAADLRKIFQTAENKLTDFHKSTILFIDEIHCFKKNQQDLLLPYVENGTIILIGATTENPSFELNNALLSRCRVLILKPLDEEALETLLQKVESAIGRSLPLQAEARTMLIGLANGDGRYLINMAEDIAELNKNEELDCEELLKFVDKKKPAYDKADDNHYGLISALHKSIRGSDVQAALYWFARMMDGGEHPHYILRRLARMASEDIGMADPQALLQVMAAKEAYDFLGSPEGDLAIAHAIIYCATAPKSNAQEIALNEVRADVKINNYQNPPPHILNAPTRMMKEIGYGEGYIYDHDTKYCFSGQNYFPDGMARREYYRPNERGFERELKKRLEYWDNLRKKLNGQEVK